MIFLSLLRVHVLVQIALVMLYLQLQKVWIEQIAPFIPNKDLSYEENAQAQIAELVANEEAAKQEQATLEELQQQVTDLQLALAELVEGGNV